MKRILLFLFIINSILLNGQVVKEDVFLTQSASGFPSAVINKLQADIHQELDERNSYRTSVLQKRKLDTVIYNDMFLYNMLLCGEVLYGDSISIYTNKVVEELLKNDSETAPKIHFYVIRSSAVETYYFDKGFVFITTGLIAQLENEAQFAFILAREIAHCKKQHLTLMKMQDELELSDRSKYIYSEQYADLKKPFSEKQEMEADIDALEIVKKSDYPIASIEQAFDLLEYKYLPFDDVVFERSFFETAEHKFPDAVFLKEVSAISSNTNYSDERLALRVRRAALEGDFIEKQNGKRKYIFPKQEFIIAREKARFSVCEDYLASRDYINAIYASYILSKKYPDNSYLKAIVSKALYAISMNKSSGFRNQVPVYLNVPTAYHPIAFEHEIDFGYALKEGNSQALYYFLMKVDAADLDVMAITYTWKEYKNTGNKELKNITDSLFVELFINSRIKGSSFSRYTKEELLVKDSISSSAAKMESSKYDKIKSLQVKSDLNSVDSRLKFAFVNLFKDDEFSKLFDQTWSASKRRTGTGKKIMDLSLKKVSIPKVVILDPYFTSFPSRLENANKDIERCELQKGKYISLLTTELKKNKIDFQFMNGNDSLMDATSYNDRSTIHAWLTEREKNGVNPDALVLSSENCQELAAKYGTSFFVFCGIKTISGSNGSKTVHTFKVYNILSGELVQFNVAEESYIATAQGLSITIAFCVKELSKNFVK